MKKFFVFLLVVICLGMGAGVVYMKSSEDNEGPKITFEEGKDTNYTSDDRRGSSEGCKGTG